MRYSSNINIGCFKYLLNRAISKKKNIILDGESLIIKH